MAQSNQTSLRRDASTFGGRRATCHAIALRGRVGAQKNWDATAVPLRKSKRQKNSPCARRTANSNVIFCSYDCCYGQVSKFAGSLRSDGAIGDRLSVCPLFLEIWHALPPDTCVVLSQNASIATSTLDDKTFVSKRGCSHALKGGVIRVVVRFEKDYVR